MGIGPVAATKKVMAKAGMEIGDFDVIEANEAFAAQSVAVGKELGFDLEKLNPNGGASPWAIRWERPAAVSCDPAPRNAEDGCKRQVLQRSASAAAWAAPPS